MAMLPTAPDLSVRLPRVVRAGEPFDAQIVVTAREPVTLDWIDARLESIERWSVGSGKQRVSRRFDLLALEARVFAGGVLPAGTHTMRARFDLPPQLPPSFAGASIKVEHTLSVQASIPWWPDARGSFVVPLRASSRYVQPLPHRVTNDAASGAPRVELSLASQHVAAGGVVSGAVAFFHHDPGAVEGARLALAAQTRLWSSSGYERTRGATAYTVPLAAPLPLDGTPVPFRFQLPADVAASFTSQIVALDWMLYVEVPGFFGSTSLVWAPLGVHESGELAAQMERISPPPIGDTRLRAMMEAAAAECGMAMEGNSIVGTVAGLRLEVQRAMREDVRSALVAEIELGGLGLGLSVDRARMLPQLLQRDIEVGHAAFDAAHRIAGRETAQVKAFLEGLGEVLNGGTLVRLDDDRVLLEHPDPTFDGAALAQFVRHAQGIASAVAHAAARIPPPAGVESTREEWSEVERALGGSLVVGDLSIEGRIGESEVSIGTEFAPTGRAVGHVVRVRPMPEFPPAFSLTSTSPRDEAATLAAAHGTGLSSGLAALPAAARSLSVGAGEARVSIPFETTAVGSRADPRAALRAAEVLARLGAMLGPVRGPFR
jgi:hypothetical protein